MDHQRTGERDRAGACPHVNLNDARCATRFSLGRIHQAFSVCFGAFHGCPMFHRINCEVSALETAGAHAAPEPAPLVAITVAGRGAPAIAATTGRPRGGHADEVSLRPTGT